MDKRIINCWVDYDKVDDLVQDAIYFVKPTTRHTNPDIVIREAQLTVYIDNRSKS